METRASYIIVGALVLLFTGGLLSFVIWIAKVDLEAEYDDYDIYFEESVAGLPKRGTVLYQGIPVGEVVDIDLYNKDPSKVHVWIRVRAEVPVTEDTIAVLQFQGLTGVAYIELSGGSPNSPRLEPHLGDIRPVIPSERSAFAAIFSNAPDLLTEGIGVLVQLQKILSDDKIGKIDASLTNIQAISKSAASATENLPQVMMETQRLLENLSKTAIAIEALAKTSNQVLDTEGRALLTDARTATQAARDLIINLDGAIDANEPAVTQFVTKSLPEISRMIVDLRKTARSLSRLVIRIEKNPGEVIFGGEEEEYNLETRTKEKQR